MDEATTRRWADRVARGFGWFSVGLGVAELVAPRRFARATGLGGRHALVRAYGLREIATGIALLAAARPAPWMWARVAGDALDLATLAGGRRPRAQAAMAVVVAVAACDAACAAAMSRRRPLAPVRDYADRSGWPKPPEQMRGAARDDFAPPADMQTPAPLKPYPLH